MPIDAFRGPLTLTEALKVIRQCHAKSSLGWSDHVFERMLDRDISSRQVMDVIKYGVIRKGPDRNDEYDDFVCVLRNVVAGRDVHVVVGIHLNLKDVTIITCY